MESTKFINAYPTLHLFYKENYNDEFISYFKIDWEVEKVIFVFMILVDFC